MGNQTTTKDFVQQRAEIYGIGELEQQRPIIQDQLIKIEEYFQNIISEQTKLQEQTKLLTKLNINTVSKGAKIQHSTIYNNTNTLKVYIENRITEIKKVDILGVDRPNQLKNKNEEFLDVLEGLQQQVVDQFALELHIQKVENELTSIKKQNEELLKENFNMEMEIKKLRRELSDIKGKVIPFR